MYFTYKKTVRFASEYNYDVQELFEFIIDLFNSEDIQDMINDGYTDPENVVLAILYQSNLGEVIVNCFLKDEESDFIHNVDDMEIEKQIDSVLRTQLINYYTEHWNEFSNT